MASSSIEFIQRGNVMDMAVGVIIGGAFQGIVSALTDDIINPLINGIGGAEVGGTLKIYGGQVIRYGDFITAIINFVIMAFVLSQSPIPNPQSPFLFILINLQLIKILLLFFICFNIHIININEYIFYNYFVYYLPNILIVIIICINFNAIIVMYIY